MYIVTMKIQFSGLCRDCGLKYGYIRIAISTYHLGRCYCCGEEKYVTEERDYGYPKYPPHPEFKKSLKSELKE